jgi:hypothetical protein
VGCYPLDFCFDFNPGVSVLILKIFSPKKIGEKMAFLTQNIAKLCKN